MSREREMHATFILYTAFYFRDSVSCYRPDWPHNDSPASISQVLGLFAHLLFKRGFLCVALDVMNDALHKFKPDVS